MSVIGESSHHYNMTYIHCLNRSCHVRVSFFDNFLNMFELAFLISHGIQGTDDCRRQVLTEVCLWVALKSAQVCPDFHQQRGDKTSTIYRTLLDP